MNYCIELGLLWSKDKRDIGKCKRCSSSEVKYQFNFCGSLKFKFPVVYKLWIFALCL